MFYRTAKEKAAASALFCLAGKRPKSLCWHRQY